MCFFGKPVSVVENWFQTSFRIYSPFRCPKFGKADYTKNISHKKFVSCQKLAAHQITYFPLRNPMTPNDPPPQNQRRIVGGHGVSMKYYHIA